MKRRYDLGQLKWKLAGFVPYQWHLEQAPDIEAMSGAEIVAVPAPVPGSVQKALLDAGLLPDWNSGLNARLCEWVENRHWIYQVDLPDAWFQEGTSWRLRCLGLDGCGCMRLNGRQIARFHNSHLPQVVDLTPHLAGSGNRLQIVFECPPRWLGQFGYTSRMTDWKPRFNYYWDWTSRLVQVGIWDQVTIEAVDDGEIESLQAVTGVDLERQTGRLAITGPERSEGSLPGSSALRTRARIRAELTDGATVVREHEMPAAAFSEAGLIWDDLPIQLWWPNGLGDQPLYTLRVQLRDDHGRTIDEVARTVGFKKIAWERCEGAPEDADPWICVVNGLPLFLQGVNWTPIRPNFADVVEAEYRKRLELYRDLNVNVLRVWGGAFLEKEWFYELCDELGLLVWQEFPLSSSGLDNYPPDDAQSIAEVAQIARSYISRRQHHVSLAIWCGGNELMDDRDGVRGPYPAPLGLQHPMLRRLDDIVQEMDPTRRFLPTSASGPREHANREGFGQGLHWDVHGPWKASGPLEEEWIPYWQDVDALMHSEVGCPGPSPAELILRYRGDCDVVPGTADNPLWRRSPWWIEWPEFVREKGREPLDLPEYVNWGQARQAAALRIAAQACKARFPRCGGFIVWMGHDSFPCASNTAIVDYEGYPKPAALALANVFAR